VSAHRGSVWRVVIARGATGIALDWRSVTSVVCSRVDTSEGRLYAHRTFIQPQSVVGTSWRRDLEEIDMR
jgi:hypothetical protein